VVEAIVAKIDNYSHEEHYELVCKWLSSRGMPRPDPRYLSDIGLVVDDVAIGFLYTTNSELCYIDCFVADPDACEFKRSEALDILLREIEGLALDLGFSMAQAFSALPAMCKRVLDHGYKSHGSHTIFNKEL
jgi:hypothetical protein